MKKWQAGAVHSYASLFSPNDTMRLSGKNPNNAQTRAKQVDNDVTDTQDIRADFVLHLILLKKSQKSIKSVRFSHVFGAKNRA